MSTVRLTNAEIRARGLEALIEKLGPSGALRFAMQTERGRGATQDDATDSSAGSRSLCCWPGCDGAPPAVTVAGVEHERSALPLAIHLPRGRLIA